MNPEPDNEMLDWDDVEVSADAADRAEDLLRDFAADAELDMAVIVDRSGGMVAGVASRQDVDVDTVGALVAGAFGAMRSLARELGESSIVESLHHGDKDTIYLRQIGSRYILLGVAELTLPAGIVREKAAQIAAPLAGLLGEPVPAPPSEAAPTAAAPKSPPDSGTPPRLSPDDDAASDAAANPAAGDPPRSGYAYDIG